jgi:DNA-directed RNA polymerase subunit omega
MVAVGVRVHAPFIRESRPGSKRRFAYFSIAFTRAAARLLRSTYNPDLILNAELCKKALEKVGNPNVLVNLVSRRVRQLNSGAGGLSRPMVADTTNMGIADIALLELIEDKMGWELPEPVELVKPAPKKRKRR